MPLVRLQYNGTARYFETPITGTQQSWMPGQSGFVDDSFEAAFIATGLFSYYEKERVFKRKNSLITDDGSTISTGSGSGSVAVQALSADRALAAGDLAANLVLTANRAVTLASGLGAGFNTQFSNGGTSSVTITVTPGAGVTLNGASSAVTRTLAAGQTTALLPVGANAYILPGA